MRPSRCLNTLDDEIMGMPTEDVTRSLQRAPRESSRHSTSNRDVPIGTLTIIVTMPPGTSRPRPRTLLPLTIPGAPASAEGDGLLTSIQPFGSRRGFYH